MNHNYLDDMYGVNAKLFRTTVDGKLVLADRPIEIFNGFYIIPGFSRYYINDKGTVYDRIADRKLHPNTKGYNYPWVSVQADRTNRQKSTDVHRLLGLAFLVPPVSDDVMEINHIDNDKNNYRLSNLEWVTKIENQMHGARCRKNKYLVNLRNVITDMTLKTLSIADACDVLGITRHQLDTIRAQKKLPCEVNGYEVNIIDTVGFIEKEWGKRTVVADYINGTMTEYKTLTAAAASVGMKRAAVTEARLNSNIPESSYLSGYKFFYRDSAPKGILKMQNGEELYHRYTRIHRIHNHNSVGYLVHDSIKNVTYPCESLRKMPLKFNGTRYTYPYLGGLSRTGGSDGRFKIIPIYSSRGSNVLTKAYCDFTREYDGTYNLDVPEYFDI